MKISHVDYLRRLIGKAIAERNRENLTEDVMRVKAPSTVIHRMVRDIVCDARFYSVLDEDEFWKTYGTYTIGRFIDAIPAGEWEKEGPLTMLKEDFLNEWMATHMIPLNADRRREIEADLRLRMRSGDGTGIPDPDEHDGTGLGEINLGDGIKDATNRTGEPAEGLPTILKEFMENAPGGNSPGLENDMHKAETRFLTHIHPSIVRLAEMIGRRGGIPKMRKGKFRRAPKSDISGVTVGDDLNSLLPTEVALLAVPEAERIFLDRFARKRLQVFSSASRSSGEGKKHSGPIFVCIDTSGSMTGEPEEMAKTLALAISIVAQKEERPVCIFNYSFNISFFVLKSLKAQRTRLLRFLSDSYGGGNDENRLVGFIFEKMPKLSRYRSFAGDLEGADMLVISDFRWIGLEPKQTERVLKARRKGMRIFSVGVNLDSDISRPFFNEEEEAEEEELSGFMSGTRFFRKSDFRFRFEEGVIKEQLR